MEVYTHSLILYDPLRFPCNTTLNLFLRDLDFAICLLIGDHNDISMFMLYLTYPGHGPLWFIMIHDFFNVSMAQVSGEHIQRLLL